MDRIVFKKGKGRAAPVAVRTNAVVKLVGDGMSALGFSGVETRLLPDMKKQVVSGPVAGSFRLTAEDSNTLLDIVKATSRINRHYDLFVLLQGEIQRVISHEILISAWGDFRGSGSKPKLDVISAIPGVRTSDLGDCGTDRLVKELFSRWVANGRNPMLLTSSAGDPTLHATCSCALHLAMRRMRSVLVHGIHNERDQIDSLYVALNPAPIKSGQGAERFYFLVDSVIAQIDVAFRKVAALKPAASSANEDIALKPGMLSVREQEIIKWISEGKTNVEIADILGISAFTVKNHAQRIFKKLGATNRTGAVAKYRGVGSPEQKINDG